MPQSNLTGCCGHSNEMPTLSAIQVAAYFAMAMVRWASAGLPLVPVTTHNDRDSKCGVCPYRKGAWCTKCRCLIKLKTKLATEECPDTPPRWRRF
jgi:hypothetical protein